MPVELLEKKLEQIQKLLEELKRLLARPFKEFYSDLTVIRAAERNFQLIVDIASDINTHILFEKGGKTPDTYRESFSEIAKTSIINKALGDKLIIAAKVRNILVHEYDFEEDYQKFYIAARESLPAFKEYIKKIYNYAWRKK